ncbi:MAG: cytochrome c biogenesis protein CcsA [Lentisphaeria bacterium]|nr:cytochrome c biogenesis protein CcsA [Lentisphaeria bacterium]
MKQLTIILALLLTFNNLMANETPFNVRSFGELPVLLNGRTKPLDTIARTSLLEMKGKQSIEVDGRKVEPSEWLLIMMTKPELADKAITFRIEHPNIKALLKLPDEERYFAFADFQDHVNELESNAQKAFDLDQDLRTIAQQEMIRLQSNITNYFRLQQSMILSDGNYTRMDELNAYQETVTESLDAVTAHASGKDVDRELIQKIGLYIKRYEIYDTRSLYFPIPHMQNGDPKQDWESYGRAMINTLREKKLDTIVILYAEVLDAYQQDKPAEFNNLVAKLHIEVESRVPEQASTAKYETGFNYFSPFTKSMTGYVIVFLLSLFGWLSGKNLFYKLGFWLLIGTVAVHTWGLIARVYIQGYAPVTNLYSSAVFVGWGACVLGILLEVFFKKGIGNSVSAVIGFVTLIIAHHLSLTGDTMEMMQAVLDSNFWLSTHVITVTIGYSGTFLAGMVALMYTVLVLIGRTPDKKLEKSYVSMVYGILCFSLLLSFVGTILGGIWADQSWGRFWGWDPKENGALMIVIWQAIILHARWGNMIRVRGLMALAMGGNIITAWSWFGVNLLGAGLHSYGFMDGTMKWLIIFAVVQSLFILIVLIKGPKKKIKSKAQATA